MSKVLIHCLDVIGETMAGPAIRYWEFAKALSRHHQVTLVVSNQTTLKHPDFEICSGNELLHQKVVHADAIITQRLSHRLALLAKKNGTQIILDAYDPMPLENFEIFKHRQATRREWENQSSVGDLIFSFQMADRVICANQRQRDLWTGFLLGRKQISPSVYDRDPTFGKTMALIPFGLSEQLPVKNGPGVREKFNLKVTDKIILWGGGIWNWFDPLTVIRAIAQVAQTRDDVKLVFMGIKHPNPAIPEMKMATQAVSLAKELGLYDRHVFFNFGWVPYEERHNFLLDADIGVSAHCDILETHYAFRTRMLDYIWSGLPILATEGDYFADLIRKEQLGSVVPCNDPTAMAKAVLDLVDHPQKRKAIKDRLGEISKEFHWQKLVQPLHEMIEDLKKSPKPKVDYQLISQIYWNYFQKYSPKRIATYYYLKMLESR